MGGGGVIMRTATAPNYNSAVASAIYKSQKFWQTAVLVRHIRGTVMFMKFIGRPCSTL